MNARDASAQLEETRSPFNVLSSHGESALLAEWERLLREHDVKGENAHDARLVAAMRLHGLSRILSFNAADFARYPGITALVPERIAAAGQ